MLSLKNATIFGSWQLAVGSWQLAVGSWPHTMGLSGVFVTVCYSFTTKHPKKRHIDFCTIFFQNVVKLPYIKSSINKIGEDLILIRRNEVRNEKKIYCKFALYGT